MGDVNISTPEPVGLRPRGAAAGLGSYIYKQGTSNDSNIAGGLSGTDPINDTLILSVQNKVAVIDRLTRSYGAAIGLQVLAGTDVLVENIYGAANTTVSIEGPIRSDTAGEGITFRTSGAGNITLFAIYHYE